MKWSDREKIIEEPLFKSYVFVRIEEGDLTKVRYVNGVVNFVYWQGKPAVIRDFEIEVIRKFLNEYNNILAKPFELKPEMMVKIQRGVFMDKNAKVIKIEGNRVQVNIESIGYSLVASVDKSNLSMV